MKNLAFFTCLLNMLGFALSCTADDQTAPCKATDQIAVQPSCYDPTKGLTLTASGYGKESDGWVWSVYVSKDTTINSLDFLSLQREGLSSITIPDSILSGYPKIMVQVNTNCQGVEMHSIYFSFVLRQGINCTSWVEQRQ